ncbi:putative metalloendopeptidase [Candidatus Termititenax dinenymphae]|uniref:Metalloendopeptidase n=1 Tax=Candidatus Termititenax dinenymphae TaxID=2218523 RepID=A0A388TLS3_9BACT|nr:putative metalloendopeptidase [Candidatus Termititenax dinenymphae]
MTQAKRNFVQMGHITFAFCPSDGYAPFYLHFSYMALMLFVLLSVMMGSFTAYVTHNAEQLLRATTDYRNILSENQLLHTKIRIATAKQAQFKSHIHNLKTQEEEIKELLNNSFAEMQPSAEELHAYPLVTTHRIVSKTGEFGRVLIDNNIVIEYFDDTAKPMAFQRALVTAEKLKELLASRTPLRKYAVKKTGNSVYAYINNQPIFVVLESDLQKLDEPMSGHKLADYWLKNIKTSLVKQQRTVSIAEKIPFLSKEHRQKSNIYKTLYPSINYPAYIVTLDSSETNHQIKRVEHLLKLSQQEISTYRKSFQELKNNVQAYQYRFDYTPSIPPVRNSYVVSNFGWRQHPILHVLRFHSGVDLPSWHGAPIHATAAGTVKNAGWSSSYGYYIEIDHGGGFSTLYGHNSANLVTANQQIDKNQLIAYVGATGLAAGDHCHYEVHYFNRPVDPGRFLNLNIFTANQNL